jgi:AcrR family transcriptional regulator
VGKGELTRHAILERATGLASQIGFEGLTIGRLAADLDLSKSGLFAHFRSKESLQVQLVKFVAERFVDVVVRPALATARGEPRVRALFEQWLVWGKSSALPGGCPFVAAATELDDRPGLVRDELVRYQKDWLDVIANCFRSGIKEGHYRSDADPDQFAYDLQGVMLAYHHAARLLREPKAEVRARNAFESLLITARKLTAAR